MKPLRPSPLHSLISAFSLRFRDVDTEKAARPPRLISSWKKDGLFNLESNTDRQRNIIRRLNPLRVDSAPTECYSAHPLIAETYYDNYEEGMTS